MSIVSYLCQKLSDMNPWKKKMQIWEMALNIDFKKTALIVFVTRKIKALCLKWTLGSWLQIFMVWNWGPSLKEIQLSQLFIAYDIFEKHQKLTDTLMGDYLNKFDCLDARPLKITWLEQVLLEIWKMLTSQQKKRN